MPVQCTAQHCEAVGAFQIDEGFHGETRLDGLRMVAVLRWPGAIQEGRGEAFVVIDERASPVQHEALLRIGSGKDTQLETTMFHVFSTTLEKVHGPAFAAIEFEVNVERRRARITEGLGEPNRTRLT